MFNQFIKTNLTRSEVEEKIVVEIGVFNVSGSVKSDILQLNPNQYIDINLDPGADTVMNIYDLTRRFGERSIDVLISLEILEHTRDWRNAINQMKRVLSPNGLLLIITKSLGFNSHPRINDFWRFDSSDMSKIFGDMKILSNQKLSNNGIFVKVVRPIKASFKDLSTVNVHSVGMK